MAGTTTNYGFPYPTGTDSINTGDTKIQELAQSLEDFFDGAESGSAFIDVANSSNLDDNTAYSRTGVSTSFVAFNSPTGGVSYTFTPRASGLVMLCFSGNGKASTAGVNWWISVDLSGGYTLDANKARSIAGTGTGNTSGSTTFIVDGTSGSAITCVVQAQASSSTTVTLNDHMMQAVYLG
jgi:hypothetical protein